MSTGSLETTFEIEVRNEDLSKYGTVGLAQKMASSVGTTTLFLTFTKTPTGPRLAQIGVKGKKAIIPEKPIFEFGIEGTYGFAKPTISFYFDMLWVFKGKAPIFPLSNFGNLESGVGP